MNNDIPIVNHDIVINDSEVVDKFEIMYSPPDLVTVRKRNEFIINKSNPEVFKKSINLSLEIDVLSVSYITDLNEFIFGKKSLNNSLT